MSPFKVKVVEVVKLIPRGKVASYGQVALFVGMPRAARQVGWILNGLEGNTLVPWWRVVNNTGRISIKGSRYDANDQRRLLEKEGVKVNDDLTFDISMYRFQPDDEFISKLKLDPMYLDMIGNKIPFSKNFITESKKTPGVSSWDELDSDNAIAVPSSAYMSSSFRGDPNRKRSLAKLKFGEIGEDVIK